MISIGSLEDRSIDLKLGTECTILNLI